MRDRLAGIPGAETVARAEARDGLRRHRQLVFRALTPLVLFGFLIALSAFSGGDRAEDSYSLAITGDTDQATALIALLDAHPRVSVFETDDPARAAAEEADATLAFSGASDEAWSRGEPFEIVVYTTVLDANSRAAVSLVHSILTRDWRDRRLEATGASPTFDVSVVDVVTTPEGARSTLAQLVAALVVLQSVVLVGGAATRFTGRTVTGTLTAQLLLPLRRSELLLGKGLGELAVGLVASAPFLAIIALVATLVAGFDGGVLAGVLALATVALTAAVLSFVAISIGLLIGVASRSAEQSSLYSTFAIVFVAVIVNFVILDEPRSNLAALIPVAGSAKVLRDVVAGTGSLQVAIVATATSVVLGLLFVALAGRRLDIERLALRAS